jgi:hypothetical protein
MRSVETASAGKSVEDSVKTGLRELYLSIWKAMKFTENGLQG